MDQKRIVLLEDDAAVNEGLMLMLQHAGYDVHAYFSVDELNSSGITEVDLYLIDWQIDSHDGLDVCRTLKANEATMQIPVIIMSAKSATEQYIIQAGGDAFLEKPFSKKQLITLVKRLIK